MDYQIITNNPEVKKIHNNVVFVEGGFEDVLLKVRDLIHSGYELITHPLGASIRMMFSPYRSIIVGSRQKNINDIFVETIESSIANYRKHMEVRKPDIENSSDYALIDSQLLESAIAEHKSLRNL